MQPLEHIRINVFGVTRPEMARIAGVHPSTVMRWEEVGMPPTLAPLRLIRDEAIRRGLDWDDALFFDIPRPAPTPHREVA